MTTTVNGVTITLTKEQLQEIENQKKKESKQSSAEGRFLELVQGLEMRLDKNYPDWICFYKNNQWYFQYNLKNKYLWCQWDRVWSVFKTEFGWKYHEIQSFIKEQVYKHFKIEGVTPLWLKF